MGFALFWVMQLHLSWIVMLPFVVFSFACELRGPRKAIFRSAGYFLLGCVLTGSLLLPTLFKYGLRAGLGGTGSAVALNINNLPSVLNPVEGVLPRFLSFASFEMARFLGNNSAKRWLFVQEHLWLTPVLLLLLLVGIFQPFAMILIWFMKKPEQKDWQPIRHLTLATVILLCITFLFSVKPPAAHTFYVTLPIAMIFSFYCWSSFLLKSVWQKFAMVFLVCGVVFHTALAIYHFRSISLYIDRKIPVTAIEKKDYRILGERRAGARY
jgi:hypothetical protein